MISEIVRGQFDDYQLSKHDPFFSTVDLPKSAGRITLSRCKWQVALLKKQEVELLLSTRALLDELLETLEVSNDPRTAKAVKDGMKGLKSGRVRSYGDFVKEFPGL